jgi:hypothetical protein
LNEGFGTGHELVLVRGMEEGSSYSAVSGSWTGVPVFDLRMPRETSSLENESSSSLSRLLVLVLVLVAPHQAELESASALLLALDLLQSYLQRILNSEF